MRGIYKDVSYYRVAQKKNPRKGKGGRFFSGLPCIMQQSTQLTYQRTRFATLKHFYRTRFATLKWKIMSKQLLTSGETVGALSENIRRFHQRQVQFRNARQQRSYSILAELRCDWIIWLKAIQYIQLYIRRVCCTHHMVWSRGTLNQHGGNPPGRKYL